MKKSATIHTPATTISLLGADLLGIVEGGGEEPKSETTVGSHNTEAPFMGADLSTNVQMEDSMKTYNFGPTISGVQNSNLSVGPTSNVVYLPPRSGQPAA